jgi:cytochrome c biogenesis protein CcdA
MMPSSNNRGLRDARVLTLLVFGLIVVLAYSDRLFGSSPPPVGAGIGSGVAFPAAFIGGILALLSPCTGVVLPAFFAYSFRSKARLLRQTYIFFLGLALVFVPLGFASSMLATLLVDYGETIYLAGGLLLLGLGVTTFFGLDLGGLWYKLTGRDVSGMGQGLVQREADDTGRSLMLGVIFGLTTSSCTAPIVGAMAALTVSAGLSSLHAMLLFVVFALGIATPLFVLAAVFERYNLGRSKLLKARPWRVGFGERKLVLLPHHVVTGSLLVLLGVFFIATRGTTELVRVFEGWGATDLYIRWTESVRGIFDAWPAWASIAVTVGGLAVLFAGLRWFARPRVSDE